MSFLPKHGNYRELRSYEKAEVAFDITHCFCRRFLKSGDRTIDQMIQAARSGKQNIAEGCRAAVTSKETEIKLVNVARASLEELLLDYEDYLRVRQLPMWSKDSKEAKFVRKIGANPGAKFQAYREYCESRPAQVVANIALCVIHQANYLLNQQLKALEAEFENEGGIRERMARARLAARHH